MKGTLAARAAEQVFVAVPAGPVRPRARRVAPIREWAREERAAHEALERARASGDAGLIEGARRAWSETWRRAPGGRRPRRRR